MDPVVGCFATEDPARSGFNWYSYCSGRPTVEEDPSGRLGVLISLDADTIELASEGAEAQEAVGILGRVSNLLKGIETIENAVDSLEIEADGVKNAGVLGDLESLGQNPKSWWKVYMKFYGADGQQLGYAHTWARIVDDVIDMLYEDPGGLHGSGTWFGDGVG